MPTLYIPVIFGSGRTDGKSIPAAHFVLSRLRAAGIDSQLFLAGDISTGVTHGPKQPHTRTAEWRDAMRRADGLFVVSPEYNHGYPGELKIALDALWDEVPHKPVAIAGTSDGLMGGGRMVEQLRLVMIALRMVPTPKQLYFLNVDTLFGPDGKMKDEEGYQKRADALIQELSLLARALKTAQQK